MAQRLALSLHSWKEAGWMVGPFTSSLSLYVYVEFARSPDTCLDSFWGVLAFSASSRNVHVKQILELESLSMNTLFFPPIFVALYWTDNVFRV